jgi:hypothetical protein
VPSALATHHRKLGAALFVLAGLVSAGTAEAVFTTAPSVTSFTAPSLTITPTGLTTLAVQPGGTFSVSGGWSGGGLDPGCPDCIVQAYLAGLSPLLGQINLDVDINFPFIQSGNYAGSFTAPLAAGTYYIGGALTYQFDFIPGVIGSANSADQVSYIINVASVSAVPEPATLALLGLGVAGIAALRQRRSN